MKTPPPPDLRAVADALDALDSLAFHVTADARDWTVNETDAWIYGVLAGWTGIELDRLADWYRWTDADLEQLRKHRAAINAVPPASHQMPPRPPSLEIHYTDAGWAALYSDGHLLQVGDAHVAEGMALSLAGVATVHDDAFMRGQKARDGVALTLDEVATFRKVRDARNARVAALLREAEALTDRARRISAGDDDV